MNSEAINSHFDVTWDRVRQITGWSTYKELADFVGTSTQSISGVKKRGKFNLEWAHNIAKTYGSYTDYIMDGVGPQKRDGLYQMAESFKNADHTNDQPMPYNDLPELNQRVLELIKILDMDEETFCRRLEMDVQELNKIKAGRPVTGVMVRALAFEFGLRLRWLRMGEKPVKAMAVVDNDFRDLYGMIEPALRAAMDKQGKP